MSEPVDEFKTVGQIPLASVISVLGAVPASELGMTMMHEHCLIDQSSWFVEYEEASPMRGYECPVEMAILADLRRRPFSTTRDNLRLNDVAVAAAELEHFRRAGGSTVVDVTSYGLGRDPLALQELARASGLNIVMGTGFYVENAHPGWVRKMTSDELADLMIAELLEGVGDTGVRAGVIGEVGTTGIPKGTGRRKIGPITPEEEKVLRAAASASLATGAAVSVHLDPIEPRAAAVVVDILESEGLAPNRIILDHMDQVEDIDYHLAMAARGVFVEFDSLGRDHVAEEWGSDFFWGHDSWRLRFLVLLIEAGHADQLLLSQDISMKIDLRRYGGVGYAHVLRNIVPSLRALGIGQEIIDGILIDNPARALAVLPSELKHYRAVEQAPRIRIRTRSRGALERLDAVKEVRAAIDCFYEAFSTGEGMDELWAHDDGVITFHPDGSQHCGWQEVRAGLRQAMTSELANCRITLSDVSIRAIGVTAWAVYNERSELTSAEIALLMDAFVTNVYEKRGGRWLMVHHHATLTDPEQLAQLRSFLSSITEPGATL
jgi:phosphotriesterase-related protein